MVDALASGASGRKAVEVRVLSWAPIFPKSPITELMMDFDPRLAVALTESANIFLS